ncbi:MAG: redoxin domain-containing protein [Limisphaerales bacterium]
MKSILFSFVVAVLLPASISAAELGDPAPELDIAKWVKGEAVKVSGDDKGIYVVEFWATWCPPCRTSIPHLTEIQKRFKDQVTIIGVTNEKEPVVEPFVDDLGAKMDYRVAIDRGETANGYMKAFGVNGIPHAFIVQEKKIIWHGHPMAGLDKTLEQVVSGKYDITKEKAKLMAESLYGTFRQAVVERDDVKADEAANQILAAVKDGSYERPFNPEKEKKEIRLGALKNMYRNAENRGQSEKAETYLKELQELDPTFNAQELRDEIALHKLANSYFEAITADTKSENYKKIGQDLSAKLKGQAEVGNNIAWAILTDASVKQRDVEFAAQVAKQAVEETNWKAPHIIDTYARALFDTGKKQEAIQTQEKALAIAHESEKGQYERILKSYKEGKVPKSQ